MADRVKLKKYNMTIARLMDIILNMSEEQQKAILKEAEKITNGDRRNFSRKGCHLPVDFAASNRTHKGHIKNISRHGVFISAQAPIVIGEEVLMVFKVHRDEEPVKLKGEIAHATRWGIGVEFTGTGPEFDREINDLIDRIQ